jgi:serine protease Do
VKIASGIDVERGLLERKPGEQIAVVVRRNDQEKRVQVALAAGDRQVRTVSVSDIVWQKLGVQFAPAASDAVTRVNSQLQGGLEVISINAKGFAAKAGIKKGDILVGLHNWETITIDNVNYVLNHPDLATFHPIPFYIVRSGKISRGQLSMLP